jgi:hypothetical protein
MVDGVHHELQGGIDQATSLFGIESFDQIHRAFDVRKQDRDGFALAISSSARF